MKKPDAILLLRGIKRKGTQGRYSEYYKIWNKYNPNNCMPEEGYVIHHKDGNPNNNHISNLQKLTDKEHKILHTSNGNHPNQNKKFSKELRKKLSEAHKGQSLMSEEAKRKLSKRMKGNNYGNGFHGKHTQETKLKISKANKGNKAWNKGLKKTKGVCGAISKQNLQK